MLLRQVLAIVNLLIVLPAIAFAYLDPRYAILTFQLVILWMFGTAILFFVLPARRTAGGPASGSGPISPGPGPMMTVDFCVYCATALPAGATICPACGRAARPI